MAKVSTTKNQTVTLMGGKAVTQMKSWIDQMARKRKSLYAKYGKPLEEQSTGKFIAISLEGQTILGEDEEALAVAAYNQFGSGNFVLAKIGHDAVSRWPTIRNA